MGRPRLCRRITAMLLGVLLYASGALVAVSHAQVTSDGTLGTTVTPDVDIFEITGGTRPDGGSNLFHSFGAFSVGADESANFINDNGLATTNILSRVTGGATSDIFGTIQTTGFPGASLFLLNPAGIVFGPGASLDVEGSFHASTADYLKLGADGVFHVDTARASVLTTSPPSAFGFLGAYTEGFIDVDGAALRVPEGETLSFVGEELHLVDSFVLAPAGDVNLVSVASAGEATFNSPINVDGFAELGPIHIIHGSVVDGKNVYIRGGHLDIEDALVFPGAFSLFGLAPPPDGGEVNVQVSGDVTISGTELVPIFEDTPGIQTFAGSSTEIMPPSDVPDIMIEAGGTVSLSGSSVVLTNRLGPGNPANVMVTADTVRVENGASISTVNTFAGPGDSVAANANTVNAPAGARDSITVNANTVELDGTGASGFTGLGAQGQFHPGYGNLDLETLPDPFDPDLTLADGGTITVNANTLIVRGGAEISADSFAFGRSGDINVNVGDLFLSGPGFIAAQSILAGNSGNVKITASGSGQIEIKDGFRISASTGGSGDGGIVDVTAGESISMSGEGSGIFSATVVPPDETLDEFASLFGVDFAFLLELASEILDIPEPDLFDVLRFLRDEFGVIDINDLTVGDAGRISVATPQATLGTEAVISSSTDWDGNAGEIGGNVGSLTLNSGAEIRSRSGLVVPDTGELLVGSGNAGKVTITATAPTTITISGANSSISTTTFGDGDGGDIELTSGGQVVISNGGSVTADSTGAGLTGNITINAGDAIVMSDGSISTQATTSDGGNIVLNAPNLIDAANSQITTSVESGLGGGGNISIDPQVVVLQNSSIIANAFGGPGGNIRIVAGQFIGSPNSVVQASSAQSIQGTVEIDSPDTDIAAAIAQLPESFLDASALLPARCAARRGGSESSFVVAGRGGVPVDPDGYLPTSYLAGLSDLERAATSSINDAVALKDVKKLVLATVGQGCAW